MDYFLLKRLSKKLFFSIEDLVEIFSLKPGSARVFAARHARKGLFIRLKNNFYVLDQAWERYAREDFFKIANFLQVPSYVSLMSALAWHEVTTQVQRGYFESICLKRSARFDQRGVIFHYYKFPKAYYCGFQKEAGVFMAIKEKAFADAIDLYSFGKYKLDLDSIDFRKFDKSKLTSILKGFPEKTRALAGKLCKI
jgi:predicted transcriptional regulator of viral defense system